MDLVLWIPLDLGSGYAQNWGRSTPLPCHNMATLSLMRNTDSRCLKCLDPDGSSFAKSKDSFIPRPRIQILFWRARGVQKVVSQEKISWTKRKHLGHLVQEKLS